MSKAEKTRQFIIEKTTMLFNKNGYAGTSLSDITEATGLTKGSIYGNFKNKDEVAIAAFKHSAATLSKQVNDVIAAQHSTLDKFQAFTDFYRNNWDSLSAKGGCPLLNSATEVDDALPFLKPAVQHSFDSWARAIVRIIEQGIEKEECQPHIKPEDFAQTFIMLIEGGILLSKLANKPDHLNLALDRVIKICKEEIFI